MPTITRENGQRARTRGLLGCKGCDTNCEWGRSSNFEAGLRISWFRSACGLEKGRSGKVGFVTMALIVYSVQGQKARNSRLVMLENAQMVIGDWLVPEDYLLDGLIMVLWVDAVRRAKLLGDLELCGVRVDCVDICRTLHLAAVDDGEADGAEAKDCAR